MAMTRVHMWSTPMAQTILDKDRVYMAALDQCVFGAETTKPTIFAFGHLNLSGIDDKRCDHKIPGVQASGRLHVQGEA